MPTVEITRTCPFCRKTYTFTVDKEAYESGMEAYKNGVLLQNAFPSFSPSIREMLKTGICGECWESL